MEWLKAFTMPTLVVCGSEDDDNGSAEELAEVLPNAMFQRSAGNAHELGHQAASSARRSRNSWRNKKGAPGGAPGWNG